MSSKQNYDATYTKPELREDMKEEIKQQDKGGRPGQWSARKSQLLVHEYEAHGGGYKNDKNHPSQSQQSLKDWGEQHWEAEDGTGQARQPSTKSTPQQQTKGKTTKPPFEKQSSDTLHRYLPHKVWTLLSDSERQEADATKTKADGDKKQVAHWPEAVQAAMLAAGHAKGSAESLTLAQLRRYAKNLGISGRSSMKKEQLIEAIRAY